MLDAVLVAMYSQLLALAVSKPDTSSPEGAMLFYLLSRDAMHNVTSVTSSRKGLVWSTSYTWKENMAGKKSTAFELCLIQSSN